MDVSNKLKAVALLQSMGAKDPGASSCISRTAFVQHDPAIADGFAGFESWLRQLPASAKVDVIRAFQDGDYVFTHSLYDLGERKAGIDIFRFQDGEIVEHWDNFQKIEAPNPSGRTLLDGATELVDLDRSEQNKSIVTDFLTTHLMNGSDEISRFFEGDQYIQHNSGIPDGVSGLLAAGKAYKEKGIRARFAGIHKVLAEGNFVLAVSEGHVGDAHISFYDLYRLQDGKIAEHWDVLETIAPDHSWKNANGKFGGLK